MVRQEVSRMIECKMRILYLSVLCSPKTYENLYAMSKIKPIAQAQKYHSLIVAGLKANGVEEIQTISALPVSNKAVRKRLFNRTKDTDAGIVYTYLPFINFPVLRQATLYLAACREILSHCAESRNERMMVIIDPLNLSLALALKTCVAFLKCKTLAIVTDIPGMQEKSENRSGIIASRLVGLMNRFKLWLMTQYDGYLLLSMQMNRLVNRKGKPYRVIEGQIDIDMKPREPHIR